MHLLVDHGGYNNLGDTAMTEAVIGRLRHNFPGATLSVFNRGFQSDAWGQPGVRQLPEQMLLPWLEGLLQKLPLHRNTPLRYRWQSVLARATLLLGQAIAPRHIRLARPGQRQVTQRLLDYCDRFDGLHVVGGDYLRDVYAIELLRKCMIMLAFAELKKPVVLTGHQLGPFKQGMYRPALYRALRQATFVGIRERIHSPGFCQAAGLDPGCYEVMGDDSLGLKAAPDGEAAALLAQQGLRPKAFIAFNLRLTRATTGQERTLQPLAETLDDLGARLRLPYLIVPVAQGDWESDRDAALRVAALTKASDVRTLPATDLTPRLAKAILGQAYGAAGASWHFCTFALSEGVPAVCLHESTYYAHKAQSLCATWQDERLALAMTDTAPTAAAEHIARVFDDAALRRQLPERAARSVALWCSVFDRRTRSAFASLN